LHFLQIKPSFDFLPQLRQKLLILFILTRQAGHSCEPVLRHTQHREGRR
jgi:hypothetical protein